MTPASPLPWCVVQDTVLHRKGAPLCVDTCGKGDVPLRVEQDVSPEYTETEIHAMAWDGVEDIIAADGHHVFCSGHDYGENGTIGLADARYAVHAANCYPDLLAALKACLDGFDDKAGTNARAAIAKAEGR